VAFFFGLRGNSNVNNCTGDAAYGPVILCPYPKNADDMYDIKITYAPATFSK
jgi:hypothetical protein